MAEVSQWPNVGPTKLGTISHVMHDGDAVSTEDIGFYSEKNHTGLPTQAPESSCVLDVGFDMHSTDCASRFA